MKLYFQNADTLLTGIRAVAEDLGIEVTPACCADITVTPVQAAGNILKVELANGQATITYGRRVSFFRGLMLLCMNLAEGKESLLLEEAVFMDSNGMQLDISRNSVLNEESLKYFIRQHALLGLSAVTFYMEDMFEIPDEPYFGYMRGRFTEEDLKRMDAYAAELGVEIVAELELLGHMAKFLRHYSNGYLRGGSVNELLVGEQTTYDFIEKIVSTISRCLRSRIVHIGLDETRTVNQGRYKQLHGEVPIEKVFFEHAHRVCKMVNDYGMTPILSGDMPFEFSWKNQPPKNANYLNDQVDALDPAVIAAMPENTAVTMWNYTEENEETLVKLFRMTGQLTDKVVYMGSARMWQSLVCKFEPTVRTVVAGMRAARRENVKISVFCTWEDSGDCPHFLALPMAIVAADMDYVGSYSREEMQRKVKFLYGVDFDDFNKMGYADHVHQNEDQELATKFLLYNDPLIGLLDYHVRDLDLRKFYGDMVRDYRDRGNARHPGMKLSFDQFKMILSILELKADYGVRLKRAYDRHDREALVALCDDARLIKARLERLMVIDRELFTFYYKGLGFETFELRRATLCARFDTLVYKLEAYLDGRLASIEELEQERLPYNCNPYENETENIFYGTGFTGILSVMM